ncbi:MAG: hypothetical protein JKY50_22435 [Oleispira sp.]|nr:hypothetical protein [Oleispira sp.]
MPNEALRSSPSARIPNDDHLGHVENAKVPLIIAGEEANGFGSRSDGSSKKALLLQGPVGPFFRTLQKQLEQSGIQTRRVTFHAADALFAINSNSVRFKGSAAEWEQWLRVELTFGQFDLIIMFGSERPAHLVAHHIAQEIGCSILSLEEGYLRSGYIACEVGGNNAGQSQLMRWKPSNCNDPQSKTPVNRHKSSLSTMVLWGAIYYFIREVVAKSSEEKLYHRQTAGVIKESISWLSHYNRRTLAKFKERAVIKMLIADRAQDYILVPLQVPSDIQMRKHSRGWDNEKLISACLTSFRENKRKQLIVFKTHPLDQNSKELVSIVFRQAKALGILDDIRVLQSGNLSELTKHSSGMIVINSTSAFSAFHHGIPLLVMGSAIYRHKEIATLGETSKDITEFWRHRSAKNAVDVAGFIQAVKSHALLPGDFYSLSTQGVTAKNVVERIKVLFRKPVPGHKEKPL